MSDIKKYWKPTAGTSLVVHWLDSAIPLQGLGSISGQLTNIPHAQSMAKKNKNLNKYNNKETEYMYIYIKKERNLQQLKLCKTDT